MTLSSDLGCVLPFDAINARFPDQVVRTELRLGELDQIINLLPSDMFSLAMNSAMRAKQLVSPNLDMAPLAPYIDDRDPTVIYPLSRILGREVIDDIYCCNCTVNGILVAGLLIAQVWPRDLYVGMLKFFDPSRPLPVEKRKSVLQEYEGLGLLSEFTSRLDKCAFARRCEHITLKANDISLVRLFQKYGYVVDATPTAREHLAAGRLIPMHKVVS